MLSKRETVIIIATVEIMVFSCSPARMHDALCSRPLHSDSQIRWLPQQSKYHSGNPSPLRMVIQLLCVTQPASAQQCRPSSSRHIPDQRHPAYSQQHCAAHPRSKSCLRADLPFAIPGLQTSFPPGHYYIPSSSPHHPRGRPSWRLTESLICLISTHALPT